MTTTQQPRALVLCDSTGAPFGFLRLVPTRSGPERGDCIFDIRPGSDAQAKRSEVRWVAKRRFERFSEHKYTLDDGTLTVRQGDFELVMLQDDAGDFATSPSLPRLSALPE